MKKTFLHTTFQKNMFLIALLITGIFCIHSSKESFAAQVTDKEKNTPTVQAGLFDSGDDCNAYLSTKKRQLVEGGTFQLSAKGVSSKYKVSFKSSDTDIVTISKTKAKKTDVVAVSSGEAYIYVRIYQKRGLFERTVKTLTCSVEVGPKAISIKLKRSTLAIRVGKTKKLGYTLKPNNTCEQPIFTSSNPRKLTINAKGKMKARATGKVKVTASIAAGKSATCMVTIRPPKT